MYGNTDIYSVGSGTGHSLNRLCALVSQITGRTLGIQHRPGRPFDVKGIVFDASAAKAAFVLAPKVPLAEGVDRTWRSLR